MKVCLNCPKEFEPNTPKAKFCSVTCRVQFHRKQGKPEMITIEKRKFDELMEAFDKAAIGTSFEVKELKGVLPTLFDKEQYENDLMEMTLNRNEPQSQPSKPKQAPKAKGDKSIAKEREPPNEAKKGFDGALSTVDQSKVTYESESLNLKELTDLMNTIRDEKIPPERNTSIGRKVWASEQRQRIQELKNKLQ